MYNTNVGSLGAIVFSGYSGLTDISYQGTKSQWNAITNGSDRSANTGNYSHSLHGRRYIKMNYLLSLQQAVER